MLAERSFSRVIRATALTEAAFLLTLRKRSPHEIIPHLESGANGNWSEGATESQLECALKRSQKHWFGRL